MKELFCEDGHLSDWGLQALAGQELNELQRLEASEHLAFCACCMERYLDQLTDDALLAPPQDLELSVARRIRAKLVSQTARRWATAAVAAALSLTLWGTGVFQWIVQPPSAEHRVPHQHESQLTKRFNQELNEVFGAVNNACDSLADFMTPKDFMPNQTQEKMRGETIHEK